MTANHSSLRPILFATALAWIATLGGAALAATPAYVGQLDGLSAVSAPGFDAVYAKAGALPKGYKSVYIAPVGIITGQDHYLDQLNANDRQVMQDCLYKHLTSDLGAKFALANKPGPGVLVIAASLTKLRANKPTMSDLQRNPGIDYARSFGIGSAGVQIDVRDGASNELLAAFVDHDEGDPLNINTNRFVQWGDAEEFIRDWAQGLADTLSG